jgi:hypothetical protein
MGNGHWERNETKRLQGTGPDPMKKLIHNGWDVTSNVVVNGTPGLCWVYRHLIVVESVNRPDINLGGPLTTTLCRGSCKEHDMALF